MANISSAVIAQVNENTRYIFAEIFGWSSLNEAGRQKTRKAALNAFSTCKIDGLSAPLPAYADPEEQDSSVYMWDFVGHAVIKKNWGRIHQRWSGGEIFSNSLTLNSYFYSLRVGEYELGARFQQEFLTLRLSKIPENRLENE